MFWIFKKRKESEVKREEIQKSFDSVREDFDRVGKWISHFDDKGKKNEVETEDLKQQLFIIKNDIEDIKDFISLFGTNISKQPQQEVIKQTRVSDVQNVVRTVVQTDILDRLTLVERGIIWALLNAEGKKLSYDDLAFASGKDKSTVRGQINIIKQKSESLISEYVESNGKKRFFISDEMRQILLKKEKVRVKSIKKNKKEEEKEEID